MKRKLLKRIGASVLVLVMTVCTFAQYVTPAREVQAETSDEPTYDAETDVMEFENDVIEIAAGGNYPFGVTVPKTETYYMSFEVKTAGEIWFMLGEAADNGRIYLGQKQFGLDCFPNNTAWGNMDNMNLIEGIKVTYSYGPDGLSLWLNGSLKFKNAKPSVVADDSMPKISWASKETTLNNVKLWQNVEPEYDALNDELAYSKETVTIPAPGYYSFGTIFPKEKTYYMSFEIQSEASDVYFNFQGDARSSSLARMVFTQGSYGLINFADGNKFTTGDIGLSRGVRITYVSSSQGISMWIDGVKKEDKLPFKTLEDGAPAVSWIAGEVTLKNIKIWTNIPEPVYDEEKHLSYEVTAVGEGTTLEDGVLTVPAGAAAGIKTPLPKDSSYYMTMELSSNSAVNLQTRSGSYINIKSNGYQLVGTKSDTWVDATAFKDIKGSGARITLYSSPNNFKIWVNGKAVIAAEYATAGKNAVPDISWTFDSAATVKDLRIWTENTAGEPTYNQAEDTPFSVTGATGEGVVFGSEITVPQLTTTSFECGLPSNEAYCATMYIKTSGIINIGARIGIYTNLQRNGYSSVGVKDASWKNDAIAANMATGIKVTIYSSTTHFKMWINGTKIVDDVCKNAADASLFVYTFANSEAKISHVKVWSEKAVIDGANLVLNDDIDVNFYVHANAGLSEAAFVKATMGDGSVKEISRSDWKFDKTARCYKFTCDVAAKEMAKEVNVAIYDGDKLVKEHSYSVKEYAETLLANPEQYAKEIPLVKAMLNYGANAQVYFAKNGETGVLANENLAAEDKAVSDVTVEKVSDFAPIKQENEKMSVVGASLILEAKTTLKVFLKFEDGVNAEDYTATCGEEQLQITKSGSYTCVLVENIDAAKLDTNYEITITNKADTTDTFTFTYSPMTYSYNVLKSDKYGTTLKDLVKALYLYNSAAKAYIAQ